jgi:ABC-type sugar transport system substrate-binding protein
MAAQRLRIDLVLAQNDVMGIGAKRAFEEAIIGPERDDWLGIPILGCDGVPSTGQTWVRTGQLTATVIVPPSAGRALSLMVQAIAKGASVTGHTFTAPVPFPAIEKLCPVKPAA